MKADRLLLTPEEWEFARQRGLVRDFGEVSHRQAVREEITQAQAVKVLAEMLKEASCNSRLEAFVRRIIKETGLTEGKRT